MNTRILIAIFLAVSGSPFAFGQMGYGGGAASQQTRPQQATTGGQQNTTTSTTTKTTYPVGVKGYLDQQMAGSKDKKFHASLNGKDLPLTLVKIHEEKKTSGNKSTAAADMKGPDGKIYQINFVLSGGQVTGASLGK
jgi:hypothetical protein